jgi:hypothetical protein
MAATARFDSFHATYAEERPSMLTPRETHIVWAALTGLAALTAVVLTVTTFQSLDLQVAGLMADLASVTEARDANGFFSLPAAN